MGYIQLKKGPHEFGWNWHQTLIFGYKTRGKNILELIEYSLSELKKKLHISERQWNEQQSRSFRIFKIVFFDYEIQMRGRSYIFIIKS